MKTHILLICVLCCITAVGQNELINTYTSKYVLHGGPAESGTTCTFSYLLVAQEKVDLAHVEFEDKKLTLNQGDALIVAIQTHQHLNKNGSNESQVQQIDSTYTWTATKQLTTFYVHSYLNNSFDHICTYFHKNQPFVARIKEGIDSEAEMAAP